LLRFDFVIGELDSKATSPTLSLPVYPVNRVYLPIDYSPVTLTC